MQRLYYSKPVTNATVNISLVGMNGSGKSAILVKYLTKRFIVEYAPYLSDSYTKTDSVDGQDVVLNIQDTCDSDDMDMDEILKWSQAIIILFSITSRRSFYRAKELIESIKQNSESRTADRHSKQNPLTSPTSLSGSSQLSLATSNPANYSGAFRRAALYGHQNTTRSTTIILVANKSDLDRFRLVEKSEAEDFAKVKGVPYFETTATATYDSVKSIFHTVVRMSNLTRFGKGAGPTGGKNLTSSTGSLSPGAPTSVLSSLAVAPGLLLQKKNPITGLTIPVPDPLPLTNENEVSNNPVSKLANLRFRGASPPTLVKNLRSSSPIVPSLKTPEGSTTNLSHTQSFTGTKTQAEHTVVRSPTTLSTSRTTTSGHQQPGKNAPTEEIDTKKATASPSSKPAPPPSKPAAPLPPKKSPLGFKLFSRKGK